MSVQKATRGIDPELAMWMAMTRRLPRVRGAGRILDLAKRVYTRKRRPPVVADVLGSRMVLDPGEFVDRSLLFGPQFYDRVERRLMRERLRPGDVFVDVGAHIGLYSLVAAQAVGPRGSSSPSRRTRRTTRDWSRTWRSMTSETSARSTSGSPTGPAPSPSA